MQAYHKLLVWDIMKKPLATRLAERALNPVIGKSFVVYATKPHLPKAAAAEPAATAESEPAEAAAPGRKPARSTKAGAKSGARKTAGAETAAKSAAKNSTGAAK